MKWEIVTTSAGHERYDLWHNEKKLLTLDFHPFTNSARIEYAAEKRVFMIRKEGFLRNKTVLRNEYGVRMGQLGYEKSKANEGQIELDGEKFFYSIHNDPLAELVIYRDTKDKPFVICGLKADNGDTSVQFNKTTELSPSRHFLLMALCWYMFLPIAKESVAIEEQVL
jgi:hypothetical protein